MSERTPDELVPAGTSMISGKARRRTGLALLLACLAGSAACGGSADSGIGVSEKRADGSELSSDDRAAADFVKSKLAEHWTRGPDGWTTELQQHNVFGQVLDGVPDVHFRELHDLRFTIVPEEPTQAQRLNGTDYRARAEFESTPERWYRTVQTFEGPQGWSDWRDGSPAWGGIAVERRQGEWLIQDADLFGGLAPDPDEIPSER